VRASASRQATTPPDTDDGMSTIDHLDAMDMDDDMDDIPKPKRKKKEKKVVPVGENGLPKRRIVKTRTTMDAKGFMGMTSFAHTIVRLTSAMQLPRTTRNTNLWTKRNPNLRRHLLPERN
jgi:hypothetical protein